MSKKTLIGLVIFLVVTCMSGYILLRWAQTLSIPAQQTKQIDASASTTLITTTNTKQLLATSSTTEPPTVQMSPTIERLLKLIKECKVESVDFGDININPPRPVNVVRLKNGTLFDSSNLINSTELSSLYQAILDMRYQCRIQINNSQLHHGDQ